jgi:hypothetical protein
LTDNIIIGLKSKKDARVRARTEETQETLMTNMTRRGAVLLFLLFAATGLIASSSYAGNVNYTICNGSDHSLCPKDLHYDRMGNSGHSEGEPDAIEVAKSLCFFIDTDTVRKPMRFLFQIEDHPGGEYGIQVIKVTCLSGRADFAAPSFSSR